MVAGQRQALAAARAASFQDIVKRKDIQVARQQVRNAEGALDTARAQKSLYTLRAPLAGQVTLVGASAGESVDTTTKLVTVTNLDRLQLQIAVPAEGASAVRPGQTVTFAVESLPGSVFHTVIVRAASQVDTATGTVPAFAVLANPGHKLRDDATVQAQVVTERHINVLAVPQAAVLTDPDSGKPTVVVVGADEVAHITPVTLGLSENGRVEVLSGLVVGQKIAVSGQYGLPDGAAVTSQTQTVDEGAAHGT
jgi:RND family efflux transporter MFP subunit